MLFKLLDFLVNSKGGYLRKPSTAMTYWRHEARKRLRSVLNSLQRTEPLGDLSSEAEDKLMSIIMIRDFPAGSCLYRLGDPPSCIYIIEEGEIELSDPLLNGNVFEHLRKNDVFGRMSFITGLHRATEAHTVRDTRVLIIPRDALMELLEEDMELRDIVAKRLKSSEIVTYLQHRHGLNAQEAADWQAQALESVTESGHYDAPIEEETIAENLVTLMQGEQRLGFFSGLSNDEALQRIENCMIHKINPPGYNYYHLGQPADRLYFLRNGTVYLLIPEDRTYKPTVVKAGNSFGGLSFFTQGTHATSAIGQDETHISVLLYRDFDNLLDESSELRRHLSKFLHRSQIAEYLKAKHNLDAGKAAKWMDKAAKSVEGDNIFPSLADMTHKVAGHASAAMAMFLGIMLDGIPESLVIGANVIATGGISMSLLAGLFLANLPEALSSAAGMKEQGMKISRIIVMWSSLMLMTGLGAALGAVILRGAPDTVFALIEGIAAGAMLTMVAETMLPEAFYKGGGIVGISTLAGFLAAIFFSTV